MRRYPSETGVMRGVLLVFACAIATGWTYADHAPLIPLLSQALRIDAFQAGLFSSVLFGVYVVGTLFATGLPERFGPKRIVGAGVAIAVSGALTLALAPSYPVALFGKVLQGIATTLTFSAGNRYIAGLYGSRRPHFALGLYGGGFPAGSALAVAIMPSLATLFADWRAAFALEAAGIAIVALLWWSAPDVPRVRRRGSMRDALRCANCWWTGVQHAGFGIAVASGTWITVFMLRTFDLPLALSGALGSTLLFVTTGARPFGGLLVARGLIRTRTAMVVANCLIICGLALLLLPERPLVLALIALVTIGFGAGLPFAAVFNTAGASLPSAPAAGQGLPTIMGSVVVLTAAPVMGLAVQTIGFEAAWGLILVLAATVLAATALVRGEEDLVAATHPRSGREAMPTPVAVEAE